MNGRFIAGLRRPQRCRNLPVLVARRKTANAVPNVALVVAAVAGLAIVAGSSASLHAEGAVPPAPPAPPVLPAAPSPTKVYVPRREKLSIYDNPSREVVTIDEPTQLELAIRETRHSVTDVFASTRGQVQFLVDEWMKVERRVGLTAQRFVAPDEKFLPGAIYVALSGFAASIITKHRSLPNRILAPPALALTAFIAFYPGTARNVTNASYQKATGDSRLITESLPDISGAVRASVDSIKAFVAEHTDSPASRDSNATFPRNA
ncbi:hypothetical protein HKX48_008365 [Thoreauomyces humboldtii]|nr:hypothetical protein HKX48_008365 [Thoreauomyces humboldtii]